MQSYKVCRGVLNLRRKFGAECLELAAREAVNAGTTSYKTVKAIAETVDPTAGHHVETDDESSFFLTHADGREVR